MVRPEKIAKASLIIIIAGIISHIFAFLREIIIAAKFGVNTSVDAFLIAMIPIFLFIMLSDTLLTSFVPIFTKERELKGKKAAWYMASNVMNVFITFLILIVSLYLVFILPIIKLITPGLNPEGVSQALRMTKIMFPILILILPITFSTAILNSYKQFSFPAFAELIPNIGVILGAVIFSNKMGVYSLAIGLMCGYVIRFLIQFFYILNELKENYVFSFHLQDPIIKNFSLFVLFTLVANGSFVVGLIVDRYFASFFAPGTIAALGYAEKLTAASYYIFIFGISTAIFPTLSQNMAIQDKEKFNSLLEKSLRIGLTFLLPVSIILIVLREPLIRLLFQRGLFDFHATKITSECVLFYAIGLFAYGGSLILTRAWYALHKPKIPALAGVVAIVIHIMGDYLLVGHFAHKGLALATSLAGIAYFSILFVMLQRETGFCQDSKLIQFFFKAILISTTMGMVSLIFGKWFLKGLNFNLSKDTLIFIFIVGMVSVMSFFSMGLIFKLKEVTLLKNLIYTKLRFIGGFFL